MNIMRRLWAKRHIEVRTIFRSDRRRDQLRNVLGPPPKTSNVKRVEPEPYPPRRHVHTI